MDDAKLREVLARMTEALKQANKEAFDAYLYARELELTLLAVPEISGRFEEEFKKIHGNREKLTELGPLQMASKGQERLVNRIESLLKHL